MIVLISPTTKTSTSWLVKKPKLYFTDPVLPHTWPGYSMPTISVIIPSRRAL